jgi:hypothetical protein
VVKASPYCVIPTFRRCPWKEKPPYNNTISGNLVRYDQVNVSSLRSDLSTEASR